MIKTYRELIKEERLKTFSNYQEVCKRDVGIIPYEDFNEYDCEQMFLNMDFDTETLECLG